MEDKRLVLLVYVPQEKIQYSSLLLSAMGQVQAVQHVCECSCRLYVKVWPRATQPEQSSVKKKSRALHVTRRCRGEDVESIFIAASVPRYRDERSRPQPLHMSKKPHLVQCKQVQLEGREQLATGSCLFLYVVY